MADKLCIFAGTTEGRTLAKHLHTVADVTVCVATEYGEVVLDGIEGIHVHTGRMDARQMQEFFAQNGFCRVIDATHPYAQVVTQNIAAAAQAAGIPLLRVLRDADAKAEGAVYVQSVSEAADYLADKEGSVLLTTGAKELSQYSKLDASRLWARVLPTASSLEACEQAGIAPAHIIAAQGPFSEEMNYAQLRMIEANYLVTKDSGKSGGFEEKINAAKRAGVTAIIVGQPPQTQGVSLDEAVSELAKHYPLGKRRVTLLGIGPGDAAYLTAQAKAALDACDAVFGAKSVTAALRTKKPCYGEYLPERVLAVLEKTPSIRNAVVAMRGDTGFYSGAKKMLAALEAEDVMVLPGVSSVSAFAAKLGTNWDDAALMSLHGRQENAVRAVSEHRKCFFLTGGENTPQALLKKLDDYGFGMLTCAVGERLSYPEEKITKGTVSALGERTFDALSVVFVENENPDGCLQVGMDDEDFIRGDVPMTKAEVRAVSVSKLQLRRDSVVWDVGAGTGSVSVECALAARDGTVYAIEKEENALELIAQNQRKFGAENIVCVAGSAPEALAALPAPTHAFIGGSGGRLCEILQVLLEKNPNVRIVLNTVTLESQTEAFRCAEQFGFAQVEAVSVNVSRSKKVGKYHMMLAQNPVTVFTLQGGRAHA